MSQALGPIIIVNTYVTEDQRYPKVAIDGYGNAIFVWMSYG